VKSQGTGWHYLADTTIGVRAAWHVAANVITIQAPPPAPKLTYTVNSVDVYIDSQTGRIVQVDRHTIVSEGTSTSDSNYRLADFVYNRGVTITACS